MTLCIGRIELPPAQRGQDMPQHISAMTWPRHLLAAPDAQSDEDISEWNAIAHTHSISFATMCD